MAFTGSNSGLTLFQGCLSIANILLGAGLLSIPYAMTLSGASGLIVIALCCLLFNTSGKFIAWGLDLLPPGLQGKGYPDLGFAALGETGRHLVTLAAILELFGGACMELLILWRSLQQLIPEKQVQEWLPGWVTIEGLAIAIGCALEVPLCLWGTFKSLSYFSAAGVMSTCSVMALVVALPLLDPMKQDLNEDVAHHTTGSGIFGATGIMALAVAGHSTFPSVRNKMADASLFPTALDGAYTITCIVVCSIGGVGYWYWGDSAQILVTDDFEAHSPYTTLKVMGMGIHHIVQALVALNVGTTVPLLLLPLVDILQSVIASGRKSAIASQGAAPGTQQYGRVDEPLLPDHNQLSSTRPPHTHSNHRSTTGREDFPTIPALPAIAAIPDPPKPALIAASPAGTATLDRDDCDQGDPIMTRKLSVRSHPIAVNLLNDQRERRVMVQPDTLTMPESFSPRTKQQACLFSPRSRGVLAALTPRRRDLLLRSFAPSSLRGSMPSTLTSSISLTWTGDLGDMDAPTADDQARNSEAFMLRCLLLALLCSFSALTRHSLDSVESVVGAVCVVFSSMLLPTLFYLALRRKAGGIGFRLWMAGSFMLVFAAGLMSLIIAQTIMKVLGVEL